MISGLTGHVIAWTVVVMVMLILYEVVLRYFFHRAPMIADEISAYLFVLVSILGLAYCLREKAHITIEIITSRLPTMMAKRLRLITLVIACAYVILMTKFSYDLVLYSHNIGRRSSSWLTIPLAWPQLPLVIGFGWLALQLVIEISKSWQSLKR